jgi:hypothetical protein
MTFINCQFNSLFTSKYGVTDANCKQQCDLPNNGTAGAADGDSGGPIIAIVIVTCVLFLLTGSGYCYWRRTHAADNEKSGIFWRKDKETQSQKTSKADDLSENPTMVRRTIYFECVHVTASFDSTDVFCILARRGAWTTSP